MPDLADEYGNTAHGESAAADGSGGFGAGTRRFLMSGIYNGDFSLAPEDQSQVIDDTNNPLPYWSFVAGGSGSISAMSTSDSAAASGYSITFTMAANGSAADDSYLEQIIPVNGARGQSYCYEPYAMFLTGATVSNAQIYITAQYLKADGVTTTGAASTAASGALATTTSIGANTLRELYADANATTIVPSNAYYLRIRVGFKRNTAAVTATETVTLTETRVLVGTSGIILTEENSPATYGFGTMYQSGGVMWLVPNNGGAGGYKPWIYLDGSDGHLTLANANSAGVLLQAADAGAAPYLELQERAAPGVAFTNGARIYARDNGAGKTQLVVIFQSGAVQVLATEP
jgi:hypothetical protein